MNGTLFRMGTGMFLTAIFLAGDAGAQDFQRSYSLPANGIVKIWNISGNIRIIGYAGDSVMVNATRTGKDRLRVEIEDKSTDGMVEVGVSYPEPCNCTASVDFDVRVPASRSFIYERLSSVSGNVELESISGRIWTQSISGSVIVKNIAGTISASSVSGKVDVYLEKTEGLGDMKFSSVSGGVTVRAPHGLDANVSMSTTSGSLKTDFPIELNEHRYRPGRSARGKLGAGSRSLRISSVSGRILLIRN